MSVLELTRLARISLVAIAIAPSPTLAVESPADAALPPPIEIPFELSHGKILLPVTVGRSRQLHVILDTGMAYEGLLLYKDLSAELDLGNTVDIQIGGAGAGKPSTGIMADSVSFHVGTHELTNQRIIVLRDSPLSGFPNDGVTGYSLFGRHAVEIDYSRETIRLHRPRSVPPDSSWVAIPLRLASNQIPWLDASVSITGRDSVPLAVYVDLASSDTIELLIRDGMKFQLPQDTREASLGTGLSGDIHGRVGTIASLALGPFVLRDVGAAFPEGAARSKQPGADGVLGNGFFQRFHVIFDYAAERLYMK